MYITISLFSNFAAMASNFDNIASYDMFTKAIDGDNAAGLGSGHICLKRTIMVFLFFF